MPSMKRGASPAKTAARAALLVLALAAGAACAGSAGISQAVRGLPDPTRPPAAALPVVAGASGDVKQEAAPQLQSILLGAAGGQGRIAVIDGQGVRVGDSFRGARVVRIADSAVELQHRGERQVLRLYAPEDVGGITRARAASRAGVQR